MTNPNPDCTVKDGSGSPQATTNGVNVTPANTVTIALASSTGVDNWSLSIIGTDELLTAPTLSVNQVARTATFTAPVAGSAMIFQSTVNPGERGREYATTFGVYTTMAGYRVGAVGETFEGDSTHGTAAKVNAVIRLGVAGVLTADPVSFTSSRTRFGTAAAQAETVIGGVAVTDATETEVDWIDHDEGVGADYTAPCLVLDADTGDVWRADYASTFGRFGVTTPLEVGTGSGPLNVRVTSGADIETTQPSFRIAANTGVVRLLGTGVVGKNLVLSGILQAQKVTAGSFTPPIAPSITSVTPNSGTEDGGTALTLAGVRFTGTDTTTGVTIDGANCTSIVVVSDVEITCVSPAGTAGATTIVVNNGLGTDSKAYTFTSAASYDPITDWGANLTLWAAGDNGDFANIGGYVTSIQDAGPGNNDFYALGGGSDQYGPYTASSIHGLPTVSWGPTASATGGAARYGSPNGASLKTIANLLGAGTTFVVFLVYKPTTITNTSATSYSGDGIVGSTGGYFGIYSHSRAGGVVVASIYNGGDNQTTGIACPAGTAAVIAVYAHGGNLYCSVNGAGVQSIATGAPDLTTPDLYLGSGFNPPTTASTGALAEIIVAKTYDATKLADTITALKAKYGIA